MERSRRAAITNNNSQREQLITLQKEIDRLSRIITGYESKITL